MSESVARRIEREVVGRGICTGCGACVALAEPADSARMEYTQLGPVPVFANAAGRLPPLAWDACPGKGIPYPYLYRAHYGRLPENWLLGCFEKVRTGHAADPEIRRNGASGGVMTRVLAHLIEEGLVDAAVVVRQGVPDPESARVCIAATREEALASAQSVYIPVSVLDILSRLEPGQRYAMTCLPDQAAALRRLQAAGHPAARQIRFVLGPYTGTALYPAAIRCFLRSHGVRADDSIASLRWRAGDWPGYLEIRTASGRVLRSKKVYYNFLIPFFITHASLQGMDFTNEFCDLSVGDAWSPRFEAAGGGHSVIVTRSPEMEAVIAEMERRGLLVTEPQDPRLALDMHGHMLDFKKRGSYIRNRLRRLFGRAAPRHGLRPEPLPLSRVAVELVVSGIFLAAGARPARALVALLPERWLGPAFDKLRLRWKSVSKPTKRKGLAQLRMREAPDA